MSFVLEVLIVYTKLGSYYNVGRRCCKLWKSVFSYCTECRLGTVYVMDSYVILDEHACKGRMKRVF